MSLMPPEGTLGRPSLRLIPPGPTVANGQDQRLRPPWRAEEVDHFFHGSHHPFRRPRPAASRAERCRTLACRCRRCDCGLLRRNGGLPGAHQPEGVRLSAGGNSEVVLLHPA